MRKVVFTMFVALFCATYVYSQDEEARLMRFPAIHGEQVVFSYAGDLFTVAKSGGMARKLTNGDGYEMFARFSPDGENIAFTGQYDGNTEVFLIPSTGGEPKRLTYTATLSRDDLSDRMGPNNIVMTWKDNKTIVYRSRKQSFNSFIGQLFEVSYEGGLSKELPLPAGGFCTYSPDGKKLAYNQVFREFRTWKYYRGGMADDVWIYDFISKEILNVTDNPAQDIFPMWHGDVIYFLSDRDRIMNLFSYNTKTRETKKLTNYDKYDIKFPSPGDEAIIYENGGYLYYFDFVKQQPVKIEVTISGDFADSRPQWKDASKSIRSGTVSPDGKRVILGGRGELFSLPAKTGITKNLTKSSGIHDRNCEWSPDGKWIAYISDKTGEDEIFIISQDGLEEPVQLTKNSDTYKFNLKWSPDSKKIAWFDQKKRLNYVVVDSKDVKMVDKSDAGEIGDFTWSPDSKWIAYGLPSPEKPQQIWLYELGTAGKTPVTSEWFNSSDPSFSKDGKYLYFASARTFRPNYSWTEWNHAYTDMIKLYLVTLAKDTKSPFEPENDVVELKKDEEKKPAEDKNADKKDEKKDEPVPVKIDFDGIIDRIVELPVENGAYWGVTATSEGVYYNRMKTADPKASLYYFDLKSKKEENLGNMDGFDISADGKKMFVVENGRYAVIDLPKGKIKVDDYIDVSGMKVWITPKDEWKQIFEESWRQMRDFFYDPNMHGVNWESINKKYAPLVPHVNSRYDLTYIIGEMIGELNVGHAYVSEGDRPLPPRIKTGLLGAKLSRDGSGYYRIDKILPGENWTSDIKSPLTEIGVNVKEGDYIIAVNGASTKDMNDLYQELVGTAGKQVELTVNSSASDKDARKVIVVPIDDESSLYYNDWVLGNIKKVDEATNGQVGYIHIPDMSAEGLNQFVKYFYPQVRKRALIIDDRGNGGGNVSPMIIERLRRELAVMGMGRNTIGSPSPDAMMVGPMVCLINQYSASDGDLFPYQFKAYKLGKLIGLRTWGGVVGIRGSLPFIDGGQLMRPEFAHYSADGTEWIIEGHGVDPDIEVRNDPALEYAGTDQQLNKAIEVILEELKTNPGVLPGIPPFPNKSK